MLIKKPTVDTIMATFNKAIGNLDTLITKGVDDVVNMNVAINKLEDDKQVICDEVSRAKKVKKKLETLLSDE